MTFLLNYHVSPAPTFTLRLPRGAKVLTATIAKTPEDADDLVIHVLAEGVPEQEDRTFLFSGAGQLDSGGRLLRWINNFAGGDQRQYFLFEVGTPAPAPPICPYGDLALTPVVAAMSEADALRSAG